MGCCLSIPLRQQLGSNAIPAQDSARPSGVSDPNAVSAEKEKGNEKKLGPDHDQQEDLPSSSGFAMHTDEKCDAGHKNGLDLGSGQPEDSPSSQGLATHMVKDGEMEQDEEAVPALDQPKESESPFPSGSVVHTYENEETECEVKPGSILDLAGNIPSPSGSATLTDKIKETELLEGPGHGPGQPQDVFPPSCALDTIEKEVMVITGMRAADVVLGLRRIPAGFYAVVHHSGLQWRTEIMRSSVKNDVVEWSGPIPIPSDLSATICLAVYASFELHPMLGKGEELRRLTVTVEQLLNRSVKDVPFSFSPEDGDMVSPCSSILVAVKRWKCEGSNSSTSRILDPHCPTAESRGELEGATDQGHNVLTRYRKHGERRDLERAIEQFRRAFDMCPLDHPCRAAVLSNLAMAQLVQCRINGTDASLEAPLQLYCDALAARPVGHVDRPSTLIHLAAVHLALFEKWKNKDEVARANTLLREAIELGPAESHENRAAILVFQMHAQRGVEHGQAESDGESSVELESSSSLTDEDKHAWDLSLQLLDRFQRFGAMDDLEQAIRNLEQLIESTAVWSRWYRAGLVNLSVALSYRFNHLGKLSDLEKAISRQREALDLTPDDHPDKSACLGNLGSLIRARFQRIGRLSDLEEAISRQREVVNFTPDGHPAKPARLNNLGNTFVTYFERLGNMSDLEDAISRHRDAVNLTPDGHHDQPEYLNNLGFSLITRFNRLGKLDDLEEAILRQRDAVNLTTHGHPDKAARLHYLGGSLRARFDNLGELGDLEEAILKQREASDLTPHGHPTKPGYLNSLGSSFTARFGRLGELSDLEEAISRQRSAVGLIPDGHPDKPGYLNNLGHSLRARFNCLGELNDLEEAIFRQKDAVDLIPHDHPIRAAYLHNLGVSVKARFDRLGQLSDLEEAISRHNNSVDLTPHLHPDRPARLNDLGNSFVARFQHLGKLSDLEEAISRHKGAVDFVPDSHPLRPSFLNNFSNTLMVRFYRFGKLSDLEEAISRHRDAVSLIPHGHPDKPTYLASLGSSITARFKRLGQPSDLDEVILRYKEAVDLTPLGHPNKPAHLHNLGNSVRARFQRLGELIDLEEAISRHRDAVDLTPQGHPDKPSRLNSLSTSIKTRFDRLGEWRDVEEAILICKNILDLTPHDHPDKPGFLSNLGNAFMSRFRRLGELDDLDEAILTFKDAVDLTPDDHPDKPARLNNLGNPFFARFKRLGGLNDIQQAISLYAHAACASIGPIRIRFHASRQWISCAHGIQHHTLLHAYSIAIGLLPQLAWIGLSLSHRYSELANGADVVREAAAVALDFGLPETAVEWLEQGRSIVWGELFQLRGSYEGLSSTHPEHGRKLRELSVALEHAGATYERSLSSPFEETQSAVQHATESLQQEADRHRALAIERDELLQEIRDLPGFERFLLHKEFPQLRASAHSGPVVLLNAVESRCDALIVLAEVDHVIHVPLPNLTLKRSTGLQNTLKSLLGHAHALGLKEREGKTAIWDDVGWECLLSPMWKCIVKPVLDALAFSAPASDLPRVFWCPTGPLVFLPIHAAGLYDPEYSRPGHKAFDLIISSYVPSLSILVPSLSPPAVPNSDLCLLAVHQPPSDGLSRLPGVETELKHIRAVIRDSPSAGTTLLESSIGTVEEVLSLMKKADWVHFACHGIQDTANPTESGLCLADQRRLKISDMIAVERPHGGLAFLSACQTAMGDEVLSDEAIHIAAGMLFAGYGGVVGTMWSISDTLAPHVAKDVYAQLFQNGGRPDYREAAQALHEAIGRLRDTDASFVEWLPFIHVGL